MNPLTEVRDRQKAHQRPPANATPRNDLPSSAKRHAGLPPRFDFVAKLAQFPQRVDAVLQRELPRAISTIYLDINTDICNHQCTFCDGFYRSLRAKTIPWERLRRLFDEMEELNVLSVIIAGDRGEPTLHPAIDRILNRLCHSSMHFGVYTNGTTDRTDVLEFLKRATWVRVSADAATAATHSVMHGYPAKRGDFDRVLATVGSLGGGQAEIGVSFLLDPENYCEVAAAADLFLATGAHFIEYKPKYLPSYRLDVEWLRTVSDSLRTQLANARERWGERVQVNNQITQLLSPEGVVPPLTIAARRCLTSLLRLVISTHGCYTCTPYRGEAERALGSIFESSLREIVDSAARRALVDCPCTRLCAYHAQNEALLALERESDNSVSFAHRPLESQDYFI